MKKFLTLVLTAGLLLGTLVSCGQSADTETKAPDSSAQTETVGDTTEDTAAEADTTAEAADSAETDTAAADALRASFLEKADAVVVHDDSVTFTDASGKDSITIQKNPENVVNLYASFTTLWYEAGGEVTGLIGGDSSVALYEEYIGRDITADAGVTTVATSSSGKKWDTETIIALQPDLIICSTAMSGYKTIEAPAEAAGIPVIAMRYNDFSDYLKWFKVFAHLTGHTELWNTVVLQALDEVVDVLLACPTEDTPRVFSMFSSADTLQANTSGTVVGGMIDAMHAKNIVDDTQRISWTNGKAHPRRRDWTSIWKPFLRQTPTSFLCSAMPEERTRKRCWRPCTATIRFGSPSLRYRTGRCSILKRACSTTSRTAALRKHIGFSPDTSTRI